MQRKVLTCASIVAGALLSQAGIVVAGPYAGTITETGGTVSFRLGEDANEVIIVRDGVASSLGAQTRGIVSFPRSGATNYSIRVVKNQGAGYQDTIQPHFINADVVGNEAATLLLSDDSRFLQFERPTGLAINRNAATPALFGRIYVSNPRSLATVSGRPMNDGVYVVNPDYSDALGQGDTALAGGIAWDTASSTSPWQLDLDTDGNVYIGDWSDSIGSVYRTSSEITNGVNLLNGVGGVLPFTPNGTNNHGSAAGFSIRGSLSAGNVQLYSLDEDASFDGTINGVQGLWRHDVGATTASFAGLPTPLANPMLKVQGVREHLHEGPTGLLYATQSRFDGNESGLFVISSDGSTVLYDSLADSVLLNQDSNPAGTGTLGGVQDALRTGIGSSVSPDGRWMSYATNSGGEAWAIPLLDGLPDIANRQLIFAFGGSSNDSTDFDAAGNMYVGNRTSEILRVFSPGGVSLTEWNSNGSFTYRNEPDFNGTGNYSDTTKWLLGIVPNANDAFATVGNLSSGAQTLTIDAPVSLGRLRLADGNYTVSGASTITMGAGFSEPRIVAESGTHTITAPLSIQKNIGYSASSGASLTVTNPQYASASINLTKWGGGTVTHPAIVQDNVLIRDGTLKIAAGAGTSKVKTLSFAPTQRYDYDGASLTIVNDTRGKLDLSNNAFVVDYDAASPIADLRAQLVKGRNGGPWNGASGISSSNAAAASGTTAVGFAEASAVIGAGGGTFAGVAVDGTAVLLRYTRQGDANLSGTTDISDFALLASNFNNASSTWSRGDFNYDGATDIGDFALLASNFNQSAADLPVLSGAEVPRAAVPEPATIGLIGAAFVALRRRRA